LSGDGLQAAAARSALVDGLVLQFWGEQVAANPKLGKGVAVSAIGGFGRGQLFPYSDIDLMFCIDKAAEKMAKEPIRKVSQALWDCGLHVSLVTRPPGDCERLDPANPEFALALLDLRRLGGDPEVYARLSEKSVSKLRSRDGKAALNSPN
jgi:[protein-PII] uridylyltransferase